MKFRFRVRFFCDVNEPLTHPRIIKSHSRKSTFCEIMPWFLWPLKRGTSATDGHIHVCNVLFPQHSSHMGFLWTTLYFRNQVQLARGYEGLHGDVMWDKGFFGRLITGLCHVPADETQCSSCDLTTWNDQIDRSIYLILMRIYVIGIEIIIRIGSSFWIKF